MGPKLFGLKHRGISSFSNSVISWRHFSHCGRMYSGMGLSQSNLSLHICWSICFPLSVTRAMYPLGSYMEPTVDKMPCQAKSKTSRPEIFLVWICAFCSYIVSIGAELTALVDLTICKEFKTWNWHLNGRLGLHTAIFPCLALPLAWPTLTIIVWSNPLFLFLHCSVFVLCEGRWDAFVSKFCISILLYSLLFGDCYWLHIPCTNILGRRSLSFHWKAFYKSHCNLLTYVLHHRTDRCSLWLDQSGLVY